MITGSLHIDKQAKQQIKYITLKPEIVITQLLKRQYNFPKKTTRIILYVASDFVSQLTMTNVFRCLEKAAIQIGNACDFLWRP